VRDEAEHKGDSRASGLGARRCRDAEGITDEAGVTPRKELGQHFLVDENILGVIGRLAELDPADVVLEVGPGLGVLTRYLAERVAYVHAVEIDRSLEPHLPRLPNVRVVFGDALRLDLAAFDPPPHKLISNLPYNVATPIVVESLAGLPSVERWCVMVQREVADRFFAVPGTKAYGAVSVLVQLAAERTGFHAISRTVFRPQPNVDSALVAFRRRELPAGFADVKRVVEAAFAHRRKTLPNSLELSGLVSRAAAAEALERLGRSASTRAEALEPVEFVELERRLA
jgi:16S rRNA (adenine1518-N6/adenine1519-N6)-dimethyltransferase